MPRCYHYGTSTGVSWGKRAAIYVRVSTDKQTVEASAIIKIRKQVKAVVGAILVWWLRSVKPKRRI
jgi:hypothetical protein